MNDKVVYNTLELDGEYREYKNNKLEFNYYDTKQFQQILEEKSAIEVIGNVYLGKEKKHIRNRDILYIPGNKKEMSIFEVYESRNKKCLGYVRVSQHMYIRVVENWFPVPVFLMIMALGLVAALAVGYGDFGRGDTEPTQPAYEKQNVADGEEWDGQLGDRAGDSMENQESIEIPGYNKLTVNSKFPEVTLINTDANDVYLQYTITDEEGEQLYKSELILPNETVKWNAKEVLKNGEYNLKFHISTYDMETQQPYNGANQSVLVLVGD